MKRILMLNYEFPPLGGGAANACAYLLKEFAKDPDISIDLITSSPTTYSESAFSERIRIYRVDIGKSENLHSQSLRELLSYSIEAQSLAKELTKKNVYDLVHAFFGVPCGAIAKGLGLPYIISLRGSDVPGFNQRFKLLEVLFLKRVSRHVWGSASFVTANSTFLRSLAAKTSAAPVSVILNGVDTIEFRPWERRDSDFTILSTSRFEPRKGIAALISAFGRFSETYPSAKLILVGSGRQENELRSLAHSYPAANIEFRGAVPHKDMSALYQSADVFVLPSQAEGMSNSLLEALASGLAVIASDTGDAKAVVGDGGIVTGSDSVSIERALEALAEDPLRLGGMKVAARQKSLEYDWSRAAVEYKKLYLEAIDGDIRKV